mmetsp:Transcript_3035/g.4471  ORF Transcript_3035/g.4471 Transcript_3035/m.4471 type:complete len:207 (+) Transcript_3035:120-740(+)|eukprot:CAMPEP_0194084856 /NCGR_PEP_ID=MMETSP0149-20130528/15011_1 /TAXON_ID=122233 /ORGANISM="Chaetoceros debilis, Strain MM31A-1" /LENGTH=206 /DNA_ID=CAMNT_0038767613 /DNA_START=7 /DNA_END=627 /DNA_ORIENTATION=+
MTRMINTFIVLAISGMASAAEPRLRNTISSINNERSSERSGASDHHSGTISFEKGMRCRGKFECDEEEKSGKGGMECEGGLKADFEMDTSAKDIAHEVTQVLTEQMKDVILPNHSNSIEDLLYPSKKDMEALMKMDDFRSDIEEEDGVYSKTVEFGGALEVKWGCNVTISGKYDDGEFSKKVECGFSGGGGKGFKALKDVFVETVE